MADWRGAATIPGWLAVVGMLALLSPGVRAVRAEEPAAPPKVSQGPSCQADAAEGADEVLDAIRLMQERKAAELAARPPRPPEDGEFVVLNGRGYNYGAAQIEMPSPRELRKDP